LLGIVTSYWALGIGLKIVFAIANKALNNVLVRIWVIVHCFDNLMGKKLERMGPLDK
jgi:hypothetical protein